ncbi:Bug family tripartite tricarboxylate transporter substrate binding protein [Cupriavidus sp. RAF12]|uniref:Bug family tripartite tricarboxylate transporter substrate binding protein n=1 Tax=Cupriavidus sp. RAF12 TaxID=3233050 RepID=UPI003F8DDF30
MNPTDHPFIDSRRRVLLQALTLVPCVGALPFGRSAMGQGVFPSKPVTFIVPQAAGGGADLLCRTVQGKAQEVLEQSLIIDNRPGAAGNIGTVLGARAAPDGYTITFVNLSTMALNPHLYTRPGYAVSDFEPLVWMASVANILVVNPNVPAKSLREFVALAKSKPGKLTYSTAGNGSGNHLGGEMLKSMAGIDLVHVPYKGGGPAVVAVLGGEVDASIADPLAALPHIRSGKLRALAVTSAKRSPGLPDVPAMAEVVPGYEATSWAGAMVPKGTPVAVRQKLSEALLAGLKEPANAEKLRSQLYEPVAGDAKAFAALIQRENDKWSKLIKQLGMQID